MFRVLIVWLLCLVTLAAANDYEVKHLMWDGANLFETTQGYAMNAPILARNNITTVSVNGDNVVIINPDCQETKVTKQQLAQNMPDYQSILSNTKMQLNSVESMRPNRSGVVLFSFNNANANLVYNSGVFMSNTNDMAFAKYGDNISMKKPGMPNDIKRIISNNDVVTYVFNNNQIKMKPIGCLQADEKEYVQQIKAELDQAVSDHNQKMKQFHNNMQQNLEKNMQTLKQKLQNNFGRRAQLNGQQQQSFDASTGTSAPSEIEASSFGSNWPFGQNNSPFWPGFPF